MCRQGLAYLYIKIKVMRPLTWLFVLLARSTQPLCFHCFHVALLSELQNIDTKMLSKWRILLKAKTITKLAKNPVDNKQSNSTLGERSKKPKWKTLAGL